MQTIFIKMLFKFTFFCYNRKNECKLEFNVLFGGAAALPSPGEKVAQNMPIGIF